METNVLYYGDNLRFLRNRTYFPDESVDLIYLDPPFNSKKEYNVIFREATGTLPAAQLRAFSDSWTWDETTNATYQDIIQNAPLEVSKLTAALHDALGRTDVTAYMVMMTPRLVELHRVLKKTGSIYLHCDPAAGHYLKIVMDRIFGAGRFRREISWRSGWVSGFKTRTTNWVRNHDILLYYVKGGDFTFNKERAYFPHPKGYRRRGGGENPRGVAMDDVWTDIYSPWIMSFSKEKKGYRTQKPLKLLERIIEVSSNRGDVVLDPFCGCGTALHAAHRLGRRWIGIDITHLAISVIRNELTAAFPGMGLKVVGEPVDLESARALHRHDPLQFQWWAVGVVRGRPVDEEMRKKGADKGVDGELLFVDNHQGGVKRVIVSVKGGATGARDVRDLRGVCDRENALGLFLTLQQPTGPMLREAAQAGLHHCDLYDADYPRLQVVTIEALVEHKDDIRSIVRLPPSALGLEAPPVDRVVVEQAEMELPGP